MNNQATYKRVNINWVIIIISGGFQVLLVFLYIYQLGNNPLSKPGLIFTFMLWLFVNLFSGRIKIIIDDNFAVFRSDVWIHVKIPINMIKSVSIKQFGIMELPEKNIKKYHFNYAIQAVIIRLKNGKTYQIAIENPQKIKEEIEKRMLTPNNITLIS